MTNSTNLPHLTPTAGTAIVSTPRKTSVLQPPHRFSDLYTILARCLSTEMRVYMDFDDALWYSFKQNIEHSWGNLHEVHKAKFPRAKHTTSFPYTNQARQTLKTWTNVDGVNMKWLNTSREKAIIGPVTFAYIRTYNQYLCFGNYFDTLYNNVCPWKCE